MPVSDYSDSRKGRQCDLASYDFHSFELVIGDKKVSVKIGEIDRKIPSFHTAAFKCQM